MTAGKCSMVGHFDDHSTEYRCKECGALFNVADGKVIECPICATMEDAPDLRGCPHCGGSAKLVMAWGDDTPKWKTPTYRAICQTCGCQTRECYYADDAAASWNDRVEGSA